MFTETLQWCLTFFCCFLSGGLFSRKQNLRTISSENFSSWWFLQDEKKKFPWEAKELLLLPVDLSFCLHVQGRSMPILFFSHSRPFPIKLGEKFSQTSSCEPAAISDARAEFCGSILNFGDWRADNFLPFFFPGWLMGSFIIHSLGIPDT